MNSVKYEKAVKEGERVDWYGVMVPEELITESVLMWSNSLVDEINKLESELMDIKGVSLDKRKAYIKSLQKNLQNAPYCLNGDFYLKKKERFETEIEELNKKQKTKKTTKTRATRSKTKNSDLIFNKK
jgi:hypothetical protein